jgi:hypothetical protein
VPPERAVKAIALRKVVADFELSKLTGIYACHFHSLADLLQL